MKSKVLFLISIALIILTISAVSAEDNSTLTADESLGASDEVDNTLHASSKTFQDVRNAVNQASESGTIELSGYYEGDGSPIKINKALTINGNNAVLDAKSKSGIIKVNVDDSQKVIIKDVTFRNAKTTSDKGGAINGGSLYGCTFENCGARWAGAIFEGSATNCKFVNCYAIEYGGAIENGNAKNCEFIKCSSGRDGGAIRNGNAVNCKFDGCYAGNSYRDPDINPDGGAICDGNADNCTFTNCWAAKFGGAIFQGDAKNSNFVNCKCGDKVPKYDPEEKTIHNGTGDGGAIELGNAVNCRFENCFTENYGGAVDRGSATDCEFIKCGSRKDGGAISKGDAINCVFKDCYAIGDENTSADGGSLDRGNAINCQFINSRAERYGGALNKGVATNCNFVNCRAIERCGGSIRGSAKNCNFTDSYAATDGGAVYDGDATNCIFTNCKALRLGGGVYGGSAKNCVFTNCHAKSGGGMSVRASTVKCSATNCKFTKCSADLSGGALYEVSYSSCTFSKNSAPKGNNVWFDKYNNVRIQASNRNVVYTYKYFYTIKVYGYTGKLAKNAEVVVKLNGKTYKTLKTNSKGIAEFKIKQAPGKYKVTIESLHNSVDKTLNVKHFMSFSKVKVKKSAKKLVLKAKLRRGYTGEKITFKFNGKKYTAKTKRGVAQVTIKKSVLKKLKAGQKITYQATYLKDTIKYSAKVQK